MLFKGLKNSGIEEVKRVELPAIMINGFEIAMELSIGIYGDRTFQWPPTCFICTALSST